ncbi:MULTISPECIES: hypothetical protein [unclassified Bacillus cereus group]|uniref:hypothetical protein n=1 Tax=unclassified Bacillus cereus group TaxID=2750818 RepID=UPI0029C2EA15|nr:hypothetical protein [Bacillus cereus group sp. BfR-BA-02730]MDX5808432.1 hypothetical protein [Bacillus cereus group sp. BfR-BA-02730]
MPNENMILVLFFIGIPMLTLLFCLFPIITIVVALGICLLFSIWCKITDSYMEVSDVKESISNRLDISTGEILFDLNKKNATYLRPGNYSVFTSKGEFILELGIEYNNFYWIELSQVSDVNFIDELNI